MRTVDKLVNASLQGKKMTMGSNYTYSSKTGGESTSSFVYHSTIICEIDHKKKTFYVDNGGYGTKSTTRAINAYRNTCLNTLGLTEQTKEEWKDNK